MDVLEKSPAAQKYQFKKPETANIDKALLKELYESRRFWIVLVAAIFAAASLVLVGASGFFAIWPGIFILALYVGYIRSGVKKRFWRRFAELNGWQYESYGDSDQEAGVMFRQGHSREITHIIAGAIDDRMFKIFDYKFTIGSGDDSETHYYAVFAFKFKGSFPHIYLNNKKDFYGVNVGEKIPLPGEFEKRFSLSAPRKYEIEALQIFTPDILAELLDNGFVFDVEFVNGEVLVFTPGQINDFGDFEKKFQKALELEDLFDEKLDKFKFTPIGDMPHNF